jgi:hypothetical protein
LTAASTTSLSCNKVPFQSQTTCDAFTMLTGATLNERWHTGRP